MNKARSYMWTDKSHCKIINAVIEVSLKKKTVNFSMSDQSGKAFLITVIIPHIIS